VAGLIEMAAEPVGPFTTLSWGWAASEPSAGGLVGFVVVPVVVGVVEVAPLDDPVTPVEVEGDVVGVDVGVVDVDVVDGGVVDGGVVDDGVVDEGVDRAGVVVVVVGPVVEAVVAAGGVDAAAGAMTATGSTTAISGTNSQRRDDRDKSSTPKIVAGGPTRTATVVWCAPRRVRWGVQPGFAGLSDRRLGRPPGPLPVHRTPRPVRDGILELRRTAVDPSPIGRRITASLRAAGCVAAEEEAAELVAAAGGDARALQVLVERRCAGEPLAWLTGSVVFCGRLVTVWPGVYVPRWQSEPLARAAVDRLPERGTAVELCAGAGAIAVVLGRERPRARVVATEIDPRAAACARRNGVEVFEGDLASPLPPELSGRVDVVVAVVPYVPTDELRFLPRDVLAHEPRRALDGGPDGMEHLVRAATAGAHLLARDGSLLLELGGDQAELLTPVLVGLGYRDIEIVEDEDGEPRAVCARRGR
jgi:release factor glutamine methyltransferase